MEPPLKKIIGLRVTEASKIHDYFQVGFSESAGVNIYNDTAILDSSKKDISPKSLIGLTLLNIVITTEEVRLLFSKKTTVIVSLRKNPAGYPEPIEVYPPGEQIGYTWN